MGAEFHAVISMNQRIQVPLKVERRHLTHLIHQHTWPLRGLVKRAIYAASNERLLGKTELFFVVGSGRSGTEWLSQFLSNDSNAAIFHEPDSAEDAYVLQRLINEPNFGQVYMNRFRKHQIAKRIRMRRCPIYGEVNGLLRYLVPAIKNTIPDARLFLVTRDGRDVVRSVMGMPFYVEGASGAYALDPPASASISREWSRSHTHK